MNCTPCENIHWCWMCRATSPSFPPPPVSLFPIPSTFSPGLLAALLDLPAADSSQGNEQHQQTHGQANSYPQSHRGERDVLTWSKGQRERGGQRRESLIIHSCRAKIRAQLSRLYPSPLFHHSTILLLEFVGIKILNYPHRRTWSTTWWHRWWLLPSSSPVSRVISPLYKVWFTEIVGLSEKTEISVNLCLMWTEKELLY